MQSYFTNSSLLELFLKDDLREFGYIRNLMQRGFVVFAPGIGMKGVVLIVESNAWADDVQHGNTVMAYGSLDEFFNLF